jgi:hypothetical protein
MYEMLNLLYEWFKIDYKNKKIIAKTHFNFNADWLTPQYFK